jgi:hypothetical protein
MHWSGMIVAAKRQLRGLPAILKSSGLLPKLTVENTIAIGDLIDSALGEMAGTGIPVESIAPVEDAEDEAPTKRRRA